MFRTLVLAFALSSLPVIAFPDAARPKPQAVQAIPWQPWAPRSFEAAREAGKLVLVDAEASWCHWCHVMDEKTYGDPQVARLLRERMVPIKADIDVHPDARERYEDIGWPGTTVYGPDGTILYRHQGYLGPEELRPVLEDLLSRQKAGTLRPWEVPETPAMPAPAEGLAALRDFSRAEMDGHFDEGQGGWGEQKYPIAMNLEACFSEARRTGDAGWRLRALYTLTQQRRITDAVWGGLFQYSVGPTWHRPHFEKLTSLQALYLENLAEAARATGDGDWLEDAAKVLDYLRRFMRHPEGGFFATMDADVGGYDKSLPFVDGHAYYAFGEGERLRHGLPRIDARRYAREQGLVIAALATLHRASPDPSLLADARAAVAYAEARLASEGGYRHQEGASEAFFLADQAAMLKGLLALHEATGDASLLARAEALAAFTDRTLLTEKGAYRARSRPEGATGVFLETRTPFDENLTLARALLRLHAFTGEALPKQRALAILRHFGARETLEAQGRWQGDFLLAATEALEEAPHLAVVGARGDPRAEALFRAALAAWRPGLVVVRHDPADGEPRNPDLGFPPLKVPAAFLCGGGACSSPLQGPEALKGALLRPSGTSSGR